MAGRSLGFAEGLDFTIAGEASNAPAQKPTKRVSFANVAAGSDSEPESPSASAAGADSISADPVQVGTSYKVKGGKASISKRIVADYDSDDGRIITLKHQGYTDDDVAAKLVAEGRVRYNPKTIGSRWNRMRIALEEREQEILDDELSDWHVEEDEKLEESVRAIEKKHEEEKRRLEERKWKDVSNALADLLQRKKYTGKACKERFEGVQAGTALPPIEVDSDQEGRSEMRESRITRAKEMRAMINAETKRVEAEKQIAQKAKKEESDQAAMERYQRLEAKKLEKKEQEKIKQEARIEREKQKALVEMSRAKFKSQTLWDGEKRRTEVQLLQRLYGGKWSYKRIKKLQTTQTVDSDGDNDANKGDSEDDFWKAPKVESDASNVEGDSKKSKKKGKASKKTIKTTIDPKTIEVTDETLANPRSIMNLGELETLLFTRKLPSRPADETHAQVVARLVAADKQLSNTELNTLLAEAFESQCGRMAVRLVRLQEYDASQSIAGLNGVTVKDEDFQGVYDPEQIFG